MMNLIPPKTSLAGVIFLTVIALAACSPQIEYRDVEVTREVDVVREVPVTVELTNTVEVTREIPVTVQTVRTVETTVTREVEATREVPVTRIVTATPEPTTTLLAPPPTPMPTVAATPAPTPAPTLEVVPTPTIPPQSRFESWQMEDDFHAGRKVSVFRNNAIAHEPLPNAPVITFLCDDRGYRSMYIDWWHPVVGATDTSHTPYASDYFDVYRQVDANTLLADYARRLHEFVTSVRLSPRDTIQFDGLWRGVQRDYALGTFTSAADLLESDENVKVSANHGTAIVQLDFAVEIPERVGQDSYRPFSRATIRDNWRVLSNQRTLMGDSAIGSINQSYQTIAPPQSDEDNLRILTADIEEPDQPVAMSAKWEITGLGKILKHCKDLRE